jgi:hypothetical protein
MMSPFTPKNTKKPPSKYASISGAAIIIIQKIINDIGISFIILK